MKHMPPKRLYHILDTATGLYSTGGVNPRWTKSGKAWTSAADVKRHLALWDRAHPDEAILPPSWVVESYTSVPTLFAHHTAAQFYVSKEV